MIHARDSLVIEVGEQAGLLIKAPQPVGITGDFTAEQLERNLATEQQVSRAVHLAHPSHTQEVKDLVVADTPTEP